MPLRWLVALAVGWTGAAILYGLTQQLSIVLLLGPWVYIAGDLAAGARKQRLQRAVDAAFGQLVADEVPAARGFAGRDAVVLRQQSRLVGLPPRLLDLRLVRMPDGTHYAVRAQAPRALADTIQWEVTRLTDAEAVQVLGEREVPSR